MNARSSLFAALRLAELHDVVEGERGDLDHYLAIAAELGARSVLDLGCGTGTFACLLADRGIEVTGVDLAAASLDIARTYVFAADATTLTSDLTRRFRSRTAVEDSLRSAGYTLAEVRDAPDRPGRELVFIASKP